MFLPCYENWIVYGESYITELILARPISVGISHVVNDVCLENSYRNLVMDAMGVGDAYSNDNVFSPVVAEELPNPKATNFYKHLKVVEGLCRMSVPSNSNYLLVYNYLI